MGVGGLIKMSSGDGFYIKTYSELSSLIHFLLIKTFMVMGPINICQISVAS